MQARRLRDSDLELRTLLHEEHTRLDRLFDQLVVAFRVDDRQLVAQSWSAFDFGLRAHMDLEERLILPKLHQIHPHEAAAILREHEDIRRRLLELGVGVDLHLIKEDTVVDFILALRAHAHREDVVTYRWASEHLDEPTKSSIRGSMRRALADAVHST